MLLKKAKEDRGGMVVSIVHSMNPNGSAEDDAKQAKADALQSMYENMKNGDFLAAAGDFKTAYDICYNASEEAEGQDNGDSQDSESEMTKTY